MKKRLIGYLLTLIVAIQVFPVDGFRFWSQILESNEEVMSSNLLTVEEEELEDLHFKLKRIESNKTHFYDRQINVLISQVVYSMVFHIGDVIDRNDPILIPPPNPLV